MAINYASKYETMVDERFKEGDRTSEAVNYDYSWDGVQSINVYSIPTVALSNYNRTGANRYGVPTELQDTIQTLTLTQDKAFTFTVDEGNNEDQMGVKNSAVALRRQIDEVIIPTIDKYRIAQMVAGAGTTTTLAAAVDKTNAYAAFLDANMVLTDNSVPVTGRIAFVTPAYYKFLKLEETFIKSSDLSQEMLIRGQVGEMDGVRIMAPLPSSYFANAKQQFIITHRDAMVSPIKMSHYFMHENPPGINGMLVEGRIYYDAFVLENKKMAIVSVVNP